MFSLLAAPLLAAAPLQDAKGTWIDFWYGHYPEGSAPIVRVVDSLSGPNRTVVDVIIPGVWAQHDLAADGKPYVRYTLPETNGKGTFTKTTEQVGAPELPVLGIALALPPGSTEAPINYGDFSDPPPGEVIYLDVEEVAYGGTEPAVFPLHAPGWDGDPDSGIPDGIAPQFQLDELYYSGGEPFPAHDIVLGEPFVLAGGVSAVEVDLQPFRYHPVENQLEVWNQFRAAIEHEGVPGAKTTISRQASVPAEIFTLNYEEIKHTYLEVDPDLGRTARLLILASQTHGDELLPLVEQRRLSGFDVDLRTLESLRDTNPATIRAALGQFLDAAPDGHDSYALLVGDVEQIPLHPPVEPNGQPGDGPYGRPLVDGGERVFVGRLSVDDEADLAHQVAKIIDFERSQAGSANLKQIGLAAHSHHDASFAGGDDYATWQSNYGAALATAGFGVDLTATHADAPVPELLAAATKGKVMSLYSGFGSAFSWPNWTPSGASLTPADVVAGEVEDTPIHFAFAPRTAAIDEDDSLAETWLAAPNGAVAVVGALTSLPTQAGFGLGRCFVKSWSTSGDESSPLGMQLAAALDADGSSVAEDHRWLLVGDPALTVPTGTSAATDDVIVDGNIITAENWDAAATDIGPILMGPDGGTLKVEVLDPNGEPVEGVLVSLVIGRGELGPNGELLPAFFQQDVYTGVAGDAEIDFVEVAAGGDVIEGSNLTAALNVVFADGSVRFLTDSIDIAFGDTKDIGGGVAGHLGVAPRLWSADILVAGETLDLNLDDAPPSSAGALFLSFASAPQPFLGGTFHASPVAMSWAFATDGTGAASFPLGPLPTALPAGLELTFQAAVADPGAFAGFTLSNGLLAAN